MVDSLKLCAIVLNMNERKPQIDGNNTVKSLTDDVVSEIELIPRVSSEDADFLLDVFSGRAPKRYDPDPDVLDNSTDRIIEALGQHNEPLAELVYQYIDRNLPAQRERAFDLASLILTAITKASETK